MLGNGRVGFYKSGDDTSFTITAYTQKKSEIDSKIPSNLSRREGYACSQFGALLVRTSNLLTVDFEFSTNLTVRLT